MTKPHPHFCSDCNKVYQCRITEPCHLDTAELCLDHYLARDRELGPSPLKLREGQREFLADGWVQYKKKGAK